MIKRIKKHADHHKSIHKREEIFSSIIPKVQLVSLPPISQPCKAVTQKHLWFPAQVSAVPDLSACHIAQAGFFICNALPFILQHHPLLILQDPAPKGVLSKIL